MTSANDLVVFMCPPLSDYPKPPEDHSSSELRDCPKCNQKMWLSETKKSALLFCACLNKEILLACYDCIKKHVQENPEYFKNWKRIDL